MFDACDLIRIVVDVVGLALCIALLFFVFEDTRSGKKFPNNTKKGDDNMSYDLNDPQDLQEHQDELVEYIEREHERDPEADVELSED